MWDVHISKAAGKIPLKKHVSSLYYFKFFSVSKCHK